MYEEAEEVEDQGAHGWRLHLQAAWLRCLFLWALRNVWRCTALYEVCLTIFPLFYISPVSVAKVTVFFFSVKWSRNYIGRDVIWALTQNISDLFNLYLTVWNVTYCTVGFVVSISEQKTLKLTFRTHFEHSHFRVFFHWSLENRQKNVPFVFVIKKSSLINTCF